MFTVAFIAWLFLRDVYFCLNDKIYFILKFSEITIFKNLFFALGFPFKTAFEQAGLSVVPPNLSLKDKHTSFYCTLLYFASQVLCCFTNWRWDSPGAKKITTFFIEILTLLQWYRTEPPISPKYSYISGDLEIVKFTHFHKTKQEKKKHLDPNN